MAKNFNMLRQKMSPASRRRASEKTGELLAAMALDELREARRLTQEQLGQRLKVKQPAIAKIERRADMYLSTLRGVIRAMGGEMEILAVFPDGRVPIKQLRHTRSARKARK
jgi:transcriptional regulator with XRE-family HTH domain